MEELVRGDVRRIINTQKKCIFEADEYYVAYLVDKDGTETGVMLTSKEFKNCINRFWKNKEDHPQVKSKGILKRIFNELFVD